MNRKILSFIIFGVVAVFAISGCETVPKKFKEEVSGIKSRVDTLEARVETVETKQTETERMAASQQETANEEMKSSHSNISVKHRTGRGSQRTKDIQTCLKNAGFYNGKIDGLKGKNTRKAIKEFQKANGLKADGVVGKKTWELLSKYESGTAESAPVAEEGASTK